jgi:hypothetical protein
MEISRRTTPETSSRSSQQKKALSATSRPADEMYVKTFREYQLSTNVAGNKPTADAMNVRRAAATGSAA